MASVHVWVHPASTLLSNEHAAYSTTSFSQPTLNRLIIDEYALADKVSLQWKTDYHYVLCYIFEVHNSIIISQ